MRRKRLLTFSCIIGAVLAGTLGLGVYQERQVSSRSGEAERLALQKSALAEQIRQVARERDQATNLLAAVSKENARLQLGQLLTELLRLRGQVGTLRQELALTGPGVPSLFALVGRDPAVKSQMREHLRRTFQLNSGDFFKALKLTPEQAERALELCADTQLKEMETLSALTPGTLSHQQLAQIEDNLLADFYRQSQSIWGEQGVAQFKAAHEETPAGVTVGLVNGQLGANHLAEEQAKRLVQVVKAEPSDLTWGIVDGTDLAFWGTPQDIKDHLAQLEASNQRILQQASSFLSPEQCSVLSQVLSNGITARLAYAAAYIQKQ